MKLTLKEEINKSEAFLKKTLEAAYGDVFHATAHLKILKLHVESVLRYGLPVKYTAH